MGFASPLPDQTGTRLESIAGERLDFASRPQRFTNFTELACYFRGKPAVNSLLHLVGKERNHQFAAKARNRGILGNFRPKVAQIRPGHGPELGQFCWAILTGDPLAPRSSWHIDSTALVTRTVKPKCPEPLSCWSFFVQPSLSLAQNKRVRIAKF